MPLFHKGEDKEQTAEIEELRERVLKAHLPPPVEAASLREVEKLEKTPPGVAEYIIGVNYLEYLMSLPWNVHTDDNLDLVHVERVLNQEHAGLDRLKERILEYLAVRTLKIQHNFRILVVDDEEIARNNLQYSLQKEGYQVSQSADGAKALEQLNSTKFDLVLTDLKMDSLGGMGLLERIKKESPGTDVIIFTGYGTVPSAVEALKKGAYHYLTKPLNLDEVRSAVRQALAKKQWKHRPKGPVLCFTGAPGTGKTSLGKAVATALGRKFVRLSLGGMKDEAEIKGHRRSYVGAMPSRIIEAIRQVGSSNPVFMLDEIDKVGQDFQGDPASALLEVLDPEQNEYFLDHYLDVAFDLSSVMFIATANLVDPIPQPLLDRMEVLTIPGYAEKEKKRIAFDFLIPRQVEQAGLSYSPPQFTNEAVVKIIREHTREAGLRNLEREIGSVCRKIAREVVANSGISEPISITPQQVERYLGPRKFYYDAAEARDRVGVTTGLVYSETGGDTIFVEATRMKGTKGLILTGSLCDVMQESAQAALSYVRSNARRFGIDENFYDYHDIHIHVPTGAITKTGPSAGLTVAIALISLLKERPARRDVAITGELTLSGRILPVGGIREKVLAARRAGVKVAVFPEKNRVDLEDLGEGILNGLELVLTDSVEEVAELVLR